MKIERKALLEYNSEYINKINYNKPLFRSDYTGFIVDHNPQVYHIKYIIPKIYYNIFRKLIKKP